ncbi:L-aspartate oxidase [Bacillus mojavensis]|uniref:L-aspartate oxidase n=1 Tax=Bacillus mojavensis TaxID=72360 RepID=UPI002DBB74AA|nr:L-aspartate oxidase [Bacillus mojavensis]MEC1680277.1 L-aspartate oxidase [Bacillus mojavensis]MEC1712798.1 L-aspartate oxidase [Bacillus mojavensis]
MSIKTIAVIGSGAAALALASALPPSYQVTVITKKGIKNSNSRHAQGGIAAAYAKDDSIASHMEDTLYAGCGHNDLNIVSDVLLEGKTIIENFLENDFPFDRDEQGHVSLGREGAHTNNRIFHAGGDATGSMLIDYLLKQIKSQIEVIENETAVDMLMKNGRCVGVVTKDSRGRINLRHADEVVLAAGGCGSLFQHHTNDPSVTGDGLSLAYRVGAELTDLEFAQFHPTLLVKNGVSCGLVSEAVRGEGGFLTDQNGRRIMAERHPLEDLAPRDVVSRIIHEEIAKGKRVYIDCSAISDFEVRFPTITSICEKAGVDIRKRKIPVAPGMHFLMGGVSVNRWGETTVPGLYAIGETACTGLHGANRLASNSLLEALVFGKRAAEHIMRKPVDNRYSQFTSEARGVYKVPNIELSELQNRMTSDMSIIREKDRLIEMSNWLYGLPSQSLNVKDITIPQLELSHLWQVAKLMTSSALLREESRGAHFRIDIPQADAGWQGLQIVHTKKGTRMRKNEGIWKNESFTAEKIAESLFS